MFFGWFMKAKNPDQGDGVAMERSMCWAGIRGNYEERGGVVGDKV